MAEDVAAPGHVALYGILFDTDKSDIKAESAPTLEEIGKFLKQDTKVKLYVVGHTDNVGEYGYNMGLSERRADHRAPKAPYRLVRWGAWHVATQAASLTLSRSFAFPLGTPDEVEHERHGCSSVRLEQLVPASTTWASILGSVCIQDSTSASSKNGSCLPQTISAGGCQRARYSAMASNRPTYLP